MTDTQKVLDALDRYSRRLAYYKAYAPNEFTSCCGEGSDGYADYCTIRAALEAKAVDVPDHTEMLRGAVEMLRIAKKIANDESIRLSDGKTHEYYQINKIWHLIDGSETKINTALGKETQ